MCQDKKINCLIFRVLFLRVQISIAHVSVLLYNLFLKLYMTGIRLAAKKGNKAGKWLQGGKDIFKVMEATGLE